MNQFFELINLLCMIGCLSSLISSPKQAGSTKVLNAHGKQYKVSKVCLKLSITNVALEEKSKMTL